MIECSRLTVLRTALAVLALLAGVTSAFAQGPDPRPQVSRQLTADIDRLGSSVRAERFAVDDPVRGRIVTALVRGPVSANALRALGVDVGTQAGNVTTVRLPLAVAPEVARLPGVEAIRMALPLQLHLDASIPDTRANLKRTQSPPLAGFNGTNVVVGFIDSGIEYSHDDFKNPDGSTRILSIWDQAASGSPPAPYGYGNECSQAQIQAGTCTERDFEGHGTHVSGSAVGDGSATGNAVPAFKYTGMANAASIIMVKTNFTDAGLIDGANYIFNRAAALGRPCVINMSLGTNLGPHDGTLDLELGLQALVGPGRIIVASAGNEQTSKKHGRLNSTTLLDSLSYVVPAYAGSAGQDFFLMDGWYEGTDNYTVTLTSPTNIVYGPVIKGAVFNSSNNTDGRVYIENGTTLTNNGDVNLYIEVSDLAAAPRPKAGGWRLRVNPVSVLSTGKVHFWTFANLTPTFPDAFFATKFDPDMTVGAPGTADSLICVGAHTTKASWTSSAPGLPGPWAFTPTETLNQLCTFSGNGPRRDGAMKPDLTAPGSAIASTLSTAWVTGGGGWDPVLAVDDGKHAVLQGTSMAAPHVTGAVAMMLQQNPNLTPTLARGLLTAGTRRDAPVTAAGALPNKKFGWGKLDLTSVLPNVDSVAPSVTLGSPNGGESLAIASVDTVTWSASDNVAVTSIDLEVSIDNGLNWDPIASGLPNTGSYLWSVPNTPTTQGKIRVTAHDTQNEAQDVSNNVFTIAPSVGVGDPSLAFAVHRPTPSPFSLMTAIGFDLPQTTGGALNWATTVNVYNVAGRRVREVVKTDLAPGPHSVAWDGKDDRGMLQPAGVYFFEVIAGSNRGQARAVYLR